MVGNAELAKEYNYRPQSKLSECQLDVNDQKVERHKRTDFNFSSPTTPLPLFLCAHLCLSASRSLLPLDSLLPLQWQADRAAVGAVCPGRAQRGSLVSHWQLYGRLIFTHIMWFGLKKRKQRITLHFIVWYAFNGALRLGQNKSICFVKDRQIFESSSDSMHGIQYFQIILELCQKIL